MLAGNLKDIISIYSEVEEKDDYSQRKKTYTFAFKTRAEVSFISATESMTGQMQTAQKTLKFKVRYRLSLYNERQYVLFGGDYYNIQGIDADRRRTYMILTASRVPSGTIKIT